MAFFALLGVLRGRLRRTGVRLPVPLCGDRKHLCGLDQDNPAKAGLNWTPIVFILDSWMDTNAIMYFSPEGEPA
jgi:hypothetical protein